MDQERASVSTGAGDHMRSPCDDSRGSRIPQHGHTAIRTDYSRSRKVQHCGDWQGWFDELWLLLGPTLRSLPSREEAWPPFPFPGARLPYNELNMQQLNNKLAWPGDPFLVSNLMGHAGEILRVNAEFSRDRRGTLEMLPGLVVELPGSWPDAKRTRYPELTFRGRAHHTWLPLAAIPAPLCTRETNSTPHHCPHHPSCPRASPGMRLSSTAAVTHFPSGLPGTPAVHICSSGPAPCPAHRHFVMKSVQPLAKRG
ncbi:hypothetical protein DBR06_SOUSAS2810201, partial [Sousa chinensis]